MSNTELVIIGAGAAGLMAACRATELGIKGVLIERKHQPGRKLLMCGNNRCNLSSALKKDDLLARYGSPVAEFITPAINEFGSEELRVWFQKNNVPTKVHKDNRIFPRSEKASDVLYCFTDILRERNFPIIYQSPVIELKKQNDGTILVKTDNFSITADNVLIATGGVSYPKTGSVGDGQKWAKSLGHSLQPYRAGLVGFEFAEPWLKTTREDIPITGTRLTCFSGDKILGETSGEILLSRQMATGPALLNASRFISRTNSKNISFVVDIVPNFSQEQITKAISDGLKKGLSYIEAMGDKYLPKTLVRPFLQNICKINSDKRSQNQEQDSAIIAKSLKSWKLVPANMRPLKEAIVTIGGVTMNEIDSRTMMSKKIPNLYFAGEVIDIDGPSGGFNLQAAFATALLAINNIKTNNHQKEQKRKK